MMPLYFLHVRDGDLLIRDLDGSLLNNLEAARDQAIESARELMVYSIEGEGRLGITRSVEICDAGSRILCVLPFRETVGV